jgi:hypothetical protein
MEGLLPHALLTFDGLKQSERLIGQNLADVQKTGLLLLRNESMPSRCSAVSA